MSKFTNGPNDLTIKEISERLRKGEITSTELTETAIKRIEEIDSKIKAFITPTFEVAREQAKRADEMIKKGSNKSPLCGIPYNLKDVFCTAGIKTTAASKILENFIPLYNATVYEKLMEAGAVLLGKVNTDEFTMGSSTENSAFGPTKNPWDLTRVPGGSSGGSAAAVAAGMGFFSLGTDTGGSIRQPSSFCSTVGLKPTYGLVSRYGVIPYASSFDTIGPITSSVEDLALVLSEIAGLDVKDSNTAGSITKDYTKNLNKNIKGIRIGLPEEFFADGLEKEVKEIIDQAIKVLEKLGAKVEKMSLPMTKYAIAAYYVIAKAEASSNLMRYDGIHYGRNKDTRQRRAGKIQGYKPTKNLTELYFQNRTEGFGDEAKRSIMLGTYTLSSGYYDAYYLKAAKVRTLIKREYEEAFKKYDLLLTPVSPFSAFKIGEKKEDPLQMYLSDVMTVPINPAGVPAMSVPAGFTKNGLPVGMQIIGPHHGEEKIIQLANAFEKKTGWQDKKPSLNNES